MATGYSRNPRNPTASRGNPLHHELGTRGRGSSTRGCGSSTRGRGSSTRGRGSSTRGRGSSTRGRGSSTRGRGSSRDNPRGSGGHRPHHGADRPVILGFNAFEKLRDKEPDDIVLDLASERCLPAFCTLLGSTEMTNDMVELVLEVLARSCDSNSPHYFNKLLIEIPKSMFVILHLKSHITRLCAHRNSSANPQLFIERTVKLFSEILKKIPSAFDSLPLGDLEQAVAVLVALGKISDEVKQEAEQLKVIKEESLEKERRKVELEKKRQHRSRNPEKGSVGLPPEDFRDMTIIPEYNDIYADKEPYLRKNIVEGRYEDLDHYLDVQFRLLREDFLRPLREGILDLVSRGIVEKQGVYKDIRVYKNVKILHPECSNKGLLHQIQFDNSKLRRVQWENSKRLIFGSLLCLSKDHFQTFVFATVCERDPKELAHGKVTVQFMSSTLDTQDFSRKNIYQMVETTAYFEAYDPILKGLQQTTEADLPFQRYLVECEKDIHPPKYLEHNRRIVAAPTFDFSSILCENPPTISRREQLHRQMRGLSLNRASTNATQFKEVPVVEVHKWPSREQLGLDDSQYKALQIALTREVAVIQGPPGTGKTYLGLKIAKILLSNKEKWIQGEVTGTGRHRQVNHTPILVICYTNHALDQFLEGIYDFQGNEESTIIRVGGRSKSEKLKDCNLRAIKSNKRAPHYVREGMYDVHRRLEDIENKMQRSSNVLKKCWNNILYEQTLQRTGVVDKEQFRSLMGPFRQKTTEQGRIVLHWLNLATLEIEQESVIFGEQPQIFNGRQAGNIEGLPLAGTDFSLCVSIKTKGAGCIVCSIPEQKIWMPNSKALHIDVNGIVKFTSGPTVLNRSYSRINDDKWHEVGIVYSEEDKSLMLYVDKRMESVIRDVVFPDDNSQYGLQIGCAPQRSCNVQHNFVGAMKKMIYYPSTKYSEMVMGDAKVEYEIDFMQEQRKLDDEDDIREHPMSKNKKPLLDDFDVVDPSNLVTSSEDGWEVQNKGKLKRKIGFEIRKQLQSEDVMSDGDVSRFEDVWGLNLKDRWRLYRKWVRDISQQHQNTIASIQDEYNEGMKELQELRNAQNYELLKEAHVIGMTTTGAAKFRELLHRIKPKITIVEEAAEVLESHIVTALTRGCEHLILIGDHKQLRPKPTVFQLGLDYQLDISLFERMVENGMPFACLGAQHRMRPEISLMMRHIYDNLSDHESVLNFEHIKGINKDIFFVNHREKEDDLDENRSHSNVHEAKFAGALCKYLLQQDYSPNQITVLTPYTGQLYQLKKFVPNVKDLRVCVVDNFQGEENDIIILSLVRSQDITTKEKRDIRRLIGFLSIDNRICVSLSRAKKGFFCIGNLTLMRSANDLWSKILDDMEERGSVGNALPLACQNHPATITHVTNAVDFNKAPNGGCSVPCQARLSCGHRCEQICHPKDPEHLEYDCRKKCPKSCERDHPCTRLCYQDCNKCMVQISKVVPRCGHTQSIPCHQDPSEFRCATPCSKTLHCGHDCPKECGQPCTRKCLEEVEKTWSLCDHTCKTKCYVDPSTAACPYPCGDLLKCEHPCSGTCGECKQGRVHKPCASRCGRLRFCDHACKVPCTKNCPPCPELCPNRCPHSKCLNRCGDPCVVCQEPCQWRCEHLRCTKVCGKLCNRRRCNQPCTKTLKCGHPCAGLCGEPCLKKCLVCNKKELTEIFFGSEDEEGARFLELTDCGHVFEVTGMDQYIDLQEKELKKGQSTSIQMIKCPKCKMAIRTSLRYGNIVKTILHDFEDVKRAIASATKSSEPGDFLRNIRVEIAKANLESEFPDELEEIETILETPRGLTKDQENILENQVQFLKFMMKLKGILKSAESTTPFHPFLLRGSYRGEQEMVPLKHELEMLVKWVMAKRLRFNEQELEDFNEELLRAWILFSYKAVNLAKERNSILLTNTLSTSRMEYVKKKLESGKKLNESEKEKCIKYLDYITQKHPSLQVAYTSVTEEEKKMVVKAMGFQQGHWFRCPKGHVYCIGDCGGAMEEANCPECGSRIGGTQHHVLSDNVLASDMDGARFAAWSETANNMRNWIFGD